jgi:hypothetical protein
MPEPVVIASRFCGPLDSGNGGYSCGVVASLIDGAAEVTLRRPPPLDRPIDLLQTGEQVEARVGGDLIAEAKPTVVELDTPPAPSLADAIEATARFPGHEHHLYPMCFVCGPKRASGDGLCVFPGAVTGREIVAAPFTPDVSLGDSEGRLRREIAWAALDCPSWFGFSCFHPFDGVILLGRLAARIDALPRIGDRCILAGWSLGRDGRKIHSAAALYSEAGSVLAVSRATWIVVK